MNGIFKRKHAEVLEEKAQFADGIRKIWMHENYEKIQEAHNEIVEYLKQKGFDFFSLQYLLTMTYVELLAAEYMESHKTEIVSKIKEMIGGEK